MHPLIRGSVRKGKLAYLWLARIFAAPNNYDVPLATKLKMNVNRGFLADQHVIYDLDTNESADYLSEFDWYRSRWINEPFDQMLNNKVVATEVLRHVAAVPAVFMVKNKGRMYTYEQPNRFATAQDGIEIIRQQGSVFIKPINKGKGNDVHRVDMEGENFLLDGIPASESAVVSLLERDDGWFIGETIHQHEELAKIFPDATNTVRIITLRDQDSGELKVFFAVLRLGTKETVPVDNGSRGGLVANINLDDGVVTEARSLWSKDVHEVHPDTGTAIMGAVVPQWQEVKQEALRLAGLFPYLQFVAWDILVTDEGPVVIEANTSSGVNIIQLWGPQRHGELGDFYRAQGVIK